MFAPLYPFFSSLGFDADTFLFAIVNYIDSTYTPETSHKKYYPSHTANLTRLKNKYDPNRVFHFPQDF